MKGYLVPLKPGKKVGFGREGYNLEGPILYLPEKGAILYRSSLRGDANGSALVPIAVKDFFEKGIFLTQLGKQVRGERLEPPYNTEEFNLSEGVLEVDLTEAEFQDIATLANIAEIALNRYREKAIRLIGNVRRGGN